jgi:hypothetical protein
MLIKLYELPKSIIELATLQPTASESPFDGRIYGFDAALSDVF